MTRADFGTTIGPPPVATRAGRLGLAAGALAPALLGGTTGLASGAAIAVAGLALPTIYVYALAQVLALVLVDAPLGAAFLALQAGFFALLVGGTALDRRVGGLAVLGFLACGGVLFAASARFGLVVGAGLLVALVGGGIYALHRYERVTLGLVRAER